MLILAGRADDAHTVMAGSPYPDHAFRWHGRAKTWMAGRSLSPDLIRGPALTVGSIAAEQCTRFVPRPYGRQDPIHRETQPYSGGPVWHAARQERCNAKNANSAQKTQMGRGPACRSRANAEGRTVCAALRRLSQAHLHSSASLLRALRCIFSASPANRTGPPRWRRRKTPYTRTPPPRAPCPTARHPRATRPALPGVAHRATLRP